MEDLVVGEGVHAVAGGLESGPASVIGGSVDDGLVVERAVHLDDEHQLLTDEVDPTQPLTPVDQVPLPFQHEPDDPAQLLEPVLDVGVVRSVVGTSLVEEVADAPGEQVGAFDRSVGAEDRRMLESCGPEFVLSPSPLAHMVLDRPGLAMRRMLAELIETHDPNAHLVAGELADELGDAAAGLEGAA